MPILREELLRQIEQTLYTVKEQELVARQVLKVNTKFNKAANEIGYFYYNRRGSAKVLATGASANDVPFVGEDGNYVTQKVYDIAVGIRYSFKELEASSFYEVNSNAPTIRLDLLRVENARRLIAETENKLVFVGDSKYQIKGLLNASGITVEDVADSGTGANATEKRKWKNKTPKQILEDIRKARSVARQNGIFNPDTLVLPPEQYDMLDQPYSDDSTMTIRNWLGSQGVILPRVFSARELSKEHNGFSNVDCLLVLDSSPEIAEIAVTRELELTNPVYDILGNFEQAAIESTAGVIIRHPSAIYVGKGI